MEAGIRAPSENGSTLRWSAGSGALVRALGRAESYAIHRNPYVLFGLLWGLPVPITTLSVECVACGLAPTPAQWWARLAESPWQWWFVAHPVLFAIVFGALGTVARERARQATELLGLLRLRADTDGLTGLLNHRSFQVRLREETTRAVREGRAISLLFLDLDHFKQLNDRHGHQAGDRMLKQLAVRLRGLVRPYDVVARYGGEEFAVILPGSDAAEATAAGERVRAGVADRPFAVARSGPIPITLSVGVATRAPEQSVAEWLRNADAQLYRAKRAGRNRIAVAAAG